MAPSANIYIRQSIPSDHGRPPREEEQRLRFGEVLRQRPVTEQVLVKAKLALLERDAVGEQAVRNIHDESLVEETLWTILIDELLACTSDRDIISDTIRQVMRLDQLSGPKATYRPATLFGRATTPEELARTFKTNGHFGSEAAASANIRHYRSRGLATVRTAWRDYKLGTYVMWATFDAAGGRPFEKLPRAADALRAILGLPKIDRGRPLLLLEYVLPPFIAARIPRVVEAYSGDNWVHYFHPTREEDLDRGHGRTYVWDEVAEAGGTGVPEVVHAPVRADALAADVDEIS